MLKGIQIDMLRAKAVEASRHSYSPYSKFPVGSAIVTKDYHSFLGCNVENASYGLTICAERNAVFKMIAEGEREIIAVGIYTPTDDVTPPCGACRQVINEFGPNADIYSFCKDEKNIGWWFLGQLLPGAFGPKNLLG